MPAQEARSCIVLPRIHVITDLPHTTLESLDALMGTGVDAIQVRAKDLGDQALFGFVCDVVSVIAGRATVIVNDRLDIALAAGADGVHLGLDDLPVAGARRVAPEGFLIGGTCRNLEQACAARAAGADYVGVGPVFSSTTKPGLPEPLGPDALTAISRILPVIAIAGITAERIPAVMATGAHGVAVVAAISRAPDPAQAARELVEAVRAHVCARQAR